MKGCVVDSLNCYTCWLLRITFAVTAFPLSPIPSVYPTPGSITQETASGYVTFWSAEKAGYGFSGFIIMFILYPLFPIVYSSEKYFRKRGYENTVIEHERVKKIIYSLLPIFILTIIDTYFALLHNL